MKFRNHTGIKALLFVLVIFSLIVAYGISTFASDIISGDKGYINIRNYCVEGKNGASSESTGAYVYTKFDGDETSLRMMYLSDSNTGTPRLDNYGEPIWAYCIEFGKEINSYVQRKAGSIESTDLWNSLGTERQLGIKLATMYGYPNNTFGVGGADAYAATQIVIWEFQTGIRSSLSNNQRSSVVYKGKTFEADRFVNILKRDTGENRKGMAAYHALLAEIYSHKTVPDFGSAILSLKLNRQTGKYENTFTDKNNVLSKYALSSNDAVQIAVSGSTVKLTADKSFENGKINLSRSITRKASQPLVVLQADGEGQTSIVGRFSESVIVSFDVHAENGSVDIQKMDDGTGKTIAGAKFGIYSAKNISDESLPNLSQENLIEEITTDDHGIAALSGLPYGKYFVKELVPPEGYVASEEIYTFTVDAEHAHANITVANKPEMFKISVYKQGEMLTGFDGVTVTNALSANGEKYDCYKPKYETGFLDGCEVEVHAAEDIITSDGTLRYSEGDLVDTVTTSKDGPVFTKPLYIGKYFVKEVHAPEGYVLDSQNTYVDLLSGDAEVTVNNLRQKIKLSFMKVFKNANETESMRLLENVSFGVFAGEDIMDVKADSLLEIVYPLSDGTCAVMSDLPYGYKYYIKELTTATGYVLNDKIYEFELKSDNSDNEYIELKISDTNIVENEPITEETTTVKITEKTPHVDHKTPDTSDNTKVGLTVVCVVTSLISACIVRKKLMC